jgi:hypothetical protein
MRVFLAACLAIVVVMVGAYFALNAVQRPSGVAFTTEGARIDPSWTRRHLVHASATPAAPGGMAIPAADTAMADECDVGTTWKWILVDFGASSHDAPECQ